MTRAAAWTVPVIAASAAAPAFAASPCDAKAVTMDWSNNAQYTRNMASKGTYTIPDPDGDGPGQPLVLTITNTFLGTNTWLGNQVFNFPPNQPGLRTNDNMGVTTGVGGSNAASLILHQSPKVDANKVTGFAGDSNKSITTFTFSRPVTNLVFTLRDIDSKYQDFWDGIAITGPAFTDAKNNVDILGDGSLGDPYRMKNNNIPVDDRTSGGNVTLTMASVKTFDLHYWNLTSTSSSTADGDQRVFLSNFAMSYKPC